MRDLAREELLSRLRALRSQFEHEGVAHLALFGSRARGDNRPDSDVDLVVDVEPSRKFSMLDAIRVEHIIEDSIGVQTNVVVLDPYTDPKFLASLERDRLAIF